MSGDSAVEEVYRRQTSITSHKLDQNFGVSDTPDDFYRAAWNADAVLRWDFCPSVCLSVCLSVCPSVKRVHCDKTEEIYV